MWASIQRPNKGTKIIENFTDGSRSCVLYTFISMSSPCGGYRGALPKKLLLPSVNLPGGFVRELKSEICASNAVLSTLSDENELLDAVRGKVQV